MNMQRFKDIYGSAIDANEKHNVRMQFDAIENIMKRAHEDAAKLLPEGDALLDKFVLDVDRNRGISVVARNSILEGNVYDYVEAVKNFEGELYDVASVIYTRCEHKSNAILKGVDALGLEGKHIATVAYIKPAAKGGMDKIVILSRSCDYEELHNAINELKDDVQTYDSAIDIYHYFCPVRIERDYASADEIAELLNNPEYSTICALQTLGYYLINMYNSHDVHKKIREFFDIINETGSVHLPPCPLAYSAEDKGDTNHRVCAVMDMR